MHTKHEELRTFMILSHWILLRMRNVLYESCIENQNTHFVFSNTFLKNVPFMRNCGKNGEATQATGENIVQCMHFCMLDNEGHKHTPRICNTFCFLIATLVTWKRLNVITLYVHCLSCFPFYISRINSEPLRFTQLKWFEIFEYTLNTNAHTLTTKLVAKSIFLRKSNFYSSNGLPHIQIFLLSSCQLVHLCQ